MATFLRGIPPRPTAMADKNCFVLVRSDRIRMKNSWRLAIIALDRVTAILADYHWRQAAPMSKNKKFLISPLRFGHGFQQFIA